MTSSDSWMLLHRQLGKGIANGWQSLGGAAGSANVWDLAGRTSFQSVLVIIVLLVGGGGWYCHTVPLLLARGLMRRGAKLILCVFSFAQGPLGPRGYPGMEGPKGETVSTRGDWDHSSAWPHYALLQLASSGLG